MGRPHDRRPQWRRAVIEKRDPEMKNACRLLLLRLASQDYPADGRGRMNANGVVSIPRSRLAKDLGVDEARISQYTKQAENLGFLERVRRARPGVTQVWQAVTPSPGFRRQNAFEEASEVRLAAPGDSAEQVRPAAPSTAAEDVRPGAPVPVVVGGAPARTSQVVRPGAPLQRTPGCALGGPQEWYRPEDAQLPHVGTASNDPTSTPHDEPEATA